MLQIFAFTVLLAFFSLLCDYKKPVVSWQELNIASNSGTVLGEEKQNGCIFNKLREIEKNASVRHNTRQ